MKHWIQYSFVLIFSFAISTAVTGQCNFSVSENPACGGSEVIFEVDPPTNSNLNYVWDFGDGSDSQEGIVVSHFFPSGATDQAYIVTLQVQNNSGNTLCAETVVVNIRATPQPALEDINFDPFSGLDPFTFCGSSTDNPEYLIEFSNASTVLADIVSYTIDYGDGESWTGTAADFPSSHLYTDRGAFTLVITATGTNGCVGVNSYQIFNGANPSLEAGTAGGTTGLCAPRVLDFSLGGTENNPPGTMYRVVVNGEELQQFTQQPGDDPLTNLEILFDTTSCGVTSVGGFSNSFDVRIEASNACGQTAVTIEPIEMGMPPLAIIDRSVPDPICGGDVISFANATIEAAFINNGNCIEAVEGTWALTPATGWTLLSGTFDDLEDIEIQFDEPGVYQLSMTATNPCGSDTATETITVLEPLEAQVDLSGNNLGCVPSIQTFQNNSTGENITYEWNISPITGWSFVGGTDASSEEPQIQFFFPDEYDVSLNVSNVCGSESWDTTLILIGPPTVQLPEPVLDDCETVTLDFSNSNVDYFPNGSQMAMYEWAFPGSNTPTSTDQFPTGIVYAPDDSGEFIYSVTITTECGTATASDTFFLQVPGSLMVPDDFEICSNEDPFVLSADPSNGTWSGPGVAPDGTFDPGSANVGANELTYTVGQGLCETDTMLTITVITAPEPQILSDNTACESIASVSLESDTPGGTWSSADGGVITGDTFEPQASGAGDYTITYTYTDGMTGCVAETSQTFTVFPLPTVQSDDVVFCNIDEELALPTPTPDGGSWAGTGIVDPAAGTFNPEQAGGVADYEIIYTYTDANTCTNTDTFVVSVIEPAMVDAGPDTSFCISVTAFDLADNADPGMGTWTTDDADAISGTILDPSALPVGIAHITYTVGSGSCQVQDSLAVEILPLPDIDLAGNPPGACVSTDSVLLSATPLSGTWTVDNAGVLSGNTFFPASSMTGMYTLQYSFTDANMCANTVDLPFEVYPLPDITVNDTTYCNTPGTVLLPAADPAGGTWSGPAVLDDTFNPIIAGGEGTYNLTYAFTDANGCSDTSDVVIDVVDPVFVEAGIGDTLCSYDNPIQLMDFEPVGVGAWTGNGITDPAGIFDPGLAEPGLNTLTYSVGTGNCLVEDTIQILVIDLTGTTAGPDEEACLTTPAFTLSGNDPVNGTWSGDGIVNANTGLFDPSVAGVGTHTITYTFADNLAGCDAVATKTVVVHPMPASAFSLPAEACLGQDILFTNESTDTSDPMWTFGDGAMSTDINPTHMYDAIGTYTITLISTTDQGCVDSTSQTIFVTEPPIANFALEEEEGCAVFSANFNNQSAGFDISYNWDFGNGETSTDEDPGPILYEQGFTDTTYVVTLEVTNLCATRTFEDTITVFPLPLANFGVSVDTSCTPMEVSFGNITQGNPESFSWDFGNGNVSTDMMPPAQLYFTDTTATEYTITLITNNFCGSDTASQTILVNPVEVDAFFNIPAEEGCEPYTVPFTSFTQPGTLVTWDFGDGNTSSQTNPVHTFDSTGTYEVIQYVTNGCGYDSITTQITVLPAPEVDFAIVDDRVCLGDTVQFENLSVNTAGNFWYFGDGDTSLLNNPTHVYDTAGVFTVTLTGISAENGCPATAEAPLTILALPEASLAPSTLDGCVPLMVSFENTSSPNSQFFEWDFGNGNTSNLENPVHVFDSAAAYPIRLIVTDQEGCRDDTTFFSITAHPNPLAGFDLERSQLCGVPVDVSFTNTSEGAIGYEWTFGDGGTAMLNDPTHTYQDTGLYEIQLIASNSFLCADTTTQVIRGYPQPIADFDLDPMIGCVPDSIQFFNNSTLANEYIWQFGDGASATAFNPIHTYTTAGTYDVTLVAAFDSICFDSVTLTGGVEMLPSPLANFEYEELPGTASGIIDFINTSENAISYFWDFGDGNTSTESDPTHRYFENGGWQVLLEATGGNGCVDDTLVTLLPTFFKGLWIPTGLSPENGIGDVRLFKPAGAGLKEYHVQIFSQHGELIWESKALQDGQPAEAWDGTLNGVIVPQDVYVWKAYGVFDDGTVWKGMRLKSGKYKTSGTVIVLR